MRIIYILINRLKSSGLKFSEEEKKSVVEQQAGREVNSYIRCFSETYP